MSFELKNAKATYQQLMVTIFQDTINKKIKVYVDDMIAKSKNRKDHIKTLRKLFKKLRKYQLNLNL
jgi:hypothetical protein